MTVSHKQAHTKFRFRISTALICAGLVFLPWASYFLDFPDFLKDKGAISTFSDFVVHHLSALMIFSGFLMALAFACWFSWRLKWMAVLQSLIEMFVCIGATILLPAY
jgi:hypothetical protein